MGDEPTQATEEKRGSQGSARRSILSGQIRKSKDSHKSLSTIAEEPKSLPTVSSKTDQLYVPDFPLSPTTSSEDLLEDVDEKPSTKIPMPLPAIPEPLPEREKRHTSKILKGHSQEIVVSHDRPSRSKSLQACLLTHVSMAGKPLFPTVVDDQSTTAPSILVTGFGLRNLSSLQEALQAEEHMRLKQLYRAQERQDESSSTLTESTPSVEISQPKTATTSETQTELGTPVEQLHKKKLKYLLGLQEDDEEEAFKDELSGLSLAEDVGRELPFGDTEAMRQAQIYLRAHRIFQFFQFIIVHLLSALPENPIEFIIDLLHKCLIYRAGLILPPLLHEKKHLECLFYLMDKMRTGYIELEQYKTGMHTIGVCTFNENPPRSKDGTVAKDTFIDEAYDSQSNLLNEMIRRRWLRTAPPVIAPPPPTPQISSVNTSGAECPSLIGIPKSHLFLNSTHNL